MRFCQIAKEAFSVKRSARNLKVNLNVLIKPYNYRFQYSLDKKVCKIHHLCYNHLFSVYSMLVSTLAQYTRKTS